MSTIPDYFTRLSVSCKPAMLGMQYLTILVGLSVSCKVYMLFAHARAFIYLVGSRCVNTT